MSDGQEPFHICLTVEILLGWESTEIKILYYILRCFYKPSMFSRMFVQTTFQFSFYLQIPKTFLLNVQTPLEMFCALAAPQCDIILGSFVTCVDTQEPIEMPKSLKSHKAKKLIYNKHVVIGKSPSRSIPPPPELFWDHAKSSSRGLCKGQQGSTEG